MLLYTGRPIVVILKVASSATCFEVHRGSNLSRRIGLSHQLLARRLAHTRCVTHVERREAGCLGCPVWTA